MDKKYQVFISSTYIDLKEERQAAVEAVLKAGHIPAGMELFKSGKSQLETIKKWIDESDVYLLILGGRYGSIDEETGKSYTHLEYDYAINKKMPVFAVVINDDMTTVKIKNGMQAKDVLELENSSKYILFKEDVKAKIVNFASSLSEVKLAIHENIHQFEKEHKLIGWIKGNNLKTFEANENKNHKLSEENLKLKLENEKLKTKEKNSIKFSSQLTYEEIKALLTQNEIMISKEYEVFKTDMQISLLEALLLTKDKFSLGVSNYGGMTKENKMTFYVIAPNLITFGLLEQTKNPGVTYTTIKVNEDGKKFLRLYELEKLKEKA